MIQPNIFTIKLLVRNYDNNRNKKDSYRTRTKGCSLFNNMWRICHIYDYNIHVYNENTKHKNKAFVQKKDNHHISAKRKCKFLF